MELDKIFFIPGNIVTIKHDIDNKPKMLVVEKKTRTILNKENNTPEILFDGIKCRWFNKNQDLCEGVFNSKDLVLIKQ